MQRAQPIHKIRYDWSSGFRIAIVNSGVFFLFSSIGVLTEATPLGVHFCASVLFFIGSLVAVYRFNKDGEGLTAISFFVLSAGITFGFGTAYSMVASGPIYEMLFSTDDQVRNIPTINTMNSFSVLLVLLSAAPLIKMPRQTIQRLNLSEVLEVLHKFRLVSTVLTVIVIVTVTIAFPTPENLILRGIVDKMRFFPFLTLLLNFSSWSNISIGSKAVTIGIVVALIALGVLVTSKLSSLLPIVAMISGLYIGRYHKLSTVLFLLSMLFYFLLLAPISSQMRSNPKYDAEQNTLRERIELAVEADVFSNIDYSSSDPANNNLDSLLGRFVHGPYQSYLIDEWRQGRPGESLSDSWAALVPRVFWPDKPDITRFGGELYIQIFGGLGGSSQAPTYTGEAFWNYGWWGVFFVSIILGLELGWFSRKWLQLIFRHNTNFGILVFCVPVVAFSSYVETWISGTYIGGFLTLAVLIKIADYISPTFTK